MHFLAPHGFWGGGEGLLIFIFMELESDGNYFRGARKQGQSFGDLGCLVKCKSIYFRTKMHI